MTTLVSKSMDHWIGVDFDNTLAHFTRWTGCEDLGAPLQPMVDRVKKWLSEGQRVKIFTARASFHDDDGACEKALKEWSQKHFGKVLEITCEKDFAMVELWDDRAVRVERNTGRCLSHRRDLSEAAEAIWRNLKADISKPEDEVIENIRRTLSSHLEE